MAAFRGSWCLWASFPMAPRPGARPGCCRLRPVPGLTVVIITKDEERHVAEALASVSFADERIVVDSGSTDRTVALARAAGARVEVRGWPGYGAQRNHAAALAAHDWILVAGCGRANLSGARGRDPAGARDRASRGRLQDPQGHTLPGPLDPHDRLVPDWKLRLYDRRRARWNDAAVHESVQVDGPVQQLRGEIEHHAYRDISPTTSPPSTATRRSRPRPWPRRGAVAGRCWPPRTAVAAFLRNYLLKRGCVDGSAGLVISAMNAYYVWLKHVKLWEHHASLRR